jgi:hypothetical protein
VRVLPLEFYAAVGQAPSLAARCQPRRFSIAEHTRMTTGSTSQSTALPSRRRGRDGGAPGPWWAGHFKLHLLSELTWPAEAAGKSDTASSKELGSTSISPPALDGLPITNSRQLTNRLSERLIRAARGCNWLVTSNHTLEQ